MLAHSRIHVKIQMPIISGYMSGPKNCEIPRQSWLSWISLGGTSVIKALQGQRVVGNGEAHWIATGGMSVLANGGLNVRS
jgi:hypothetical protein